MKTVYLRLLEALRNLSSARDGNVAITFALATIPMIGFVGAAVDYSRANAVKAEMQAALDSTALMLAKEAATATSDQLQTDAQKYFKALFTRPEARKITISATYTTSGGSKVVVNGSASVPTDFMGIIGYNSITVGGSSTAKWGMSRLRVALVLDNTGSMAEAGKMNALKTATKNLLTQLKNAAKNNGDVYVSIVPFAKDVAVDRANYKENWIDWTDWDVKNKTCGGRGGRNDDDEGEHRRGGGRKCTPANHNSWNGCITDRGNSNAPSSGNYDTNVVAPTPSIKATLFPAEQYNACPQAVMGLSYDWSSMTRLVNRMSPNGSTNQAIGLAWGWLSLAGGGPFSVPPMDPNYNYSQVIILLTDGLNTQDRWYTRQSSIDARPATDDLRQYQGCRYHALYHPS